MGTVTETSLRLRALAVTLWLAAMVTTGVLVAQGDVLLLPLVVVPGYGTAGLVIAWHRPRHRIGWLLLALAAAPVGLLAASVHPWAVNGSVLLLVSLFFLLFPSGKPPSPRWWSLPGLLVAAWVAVPLASVVLPGAEFGVPAGVVVALAATIGCGLAPVARFRRAGAAEQAQLRWLGLAATLTVLAALVSLAAALFAGPEALGSATGLVAVVAGTLGIPAAVLIAVTRHRLYEIDRVVSRTVSYLVVGAVLGAGFALPVLVVSTFAGGSSDLAVAAATLGAAAAFRPLYRRVRASVDRRFNRAGYQAAMETTGFVERLRRSHDQEGIARDLAATAERILEPGRVSVWVRG